MALLARKTRTVSWDDTPKIGRLSRTKKPVRLTDHKGRTSEGRILRFTRTAATSGMLHMELPTGPAHIGVRTDRDSLTVL